MKLYDKSLKYKMIFPKSNLYKVITIKPGKLHCFSSQDNRHAPQLRQIRRGFQLQARIRHESAEKVFLVVISERLHSFLVIIVETSKHTEDWELMSNQLD